MKTKKTLYKALTIIVVIIAIIGFNSYRTYKDKQLYAELIEKNDKKWIMFMFGFDNHLNNYEANEDPNKDFYEENFLNDENLPTLLIRVKKHMDDNYPEVGYGTKHEEITVERLKSEYVEVIEEMSRLIEDFNEYSPKYETMYNMIISERLEMNRDGIWVGNGTEKVAEDSPVALERKAKAFCMNTLDVDNYERDYIFKGYKDEVFEKFLLDERLPLFLEHMKEYMDTEYPEIGYGTKYEEITVERLKVEYEDVYQEIVEISAELDKMGTSYRGISIEVKKLL